MRLPRRLAVPWFIVGMLRVCSMTRAAPVAGAPNAAAKQGAGVAASCQSCHGHAGEGNATAGFPRLAGLSAKYLERQLLAFAEGRSNAMMMPIAKALRSATARQWRPIRRTAVARRCGPGRRQRAPAVGQCGTVVDAVTRPAASAAFAQAPALAAHRASGAGSTPAVVAASTATNVMTAASAVASGPRSAVSAEVASAFHPPSEAELPAGEYGEVIRPGRDIFTDTPRLARAFAGNSMRCSSCHLDAGRLADSAPLWVAYVSYPAYRAKTKEVNTFEQRLQGCFRYSMNGTAPPPGDPVLVALQAYSYWLAQGARIDPTLPGRGYPKLAEPALAPDYERGAKVYAQRCALCHGDDGAGQRTPEGHAVFPALWGDDSFNWGAGMSNIDNAAAFIRANMPLGLAGSLSEQEAWDVALYMDSHERPQDPRYVGSVDQTRERFHDSARSMYGKPMAGKVLGDTGPPKRQTAQARSAPPPRKIP